MNKEEFKNEIIEQTWIKKYNSMLETILCKCDQCKNNINHECFHRGAKDENFKHMPVVYCFEEK